MTNNPSGGCGCKIEGRGTALQYTHDEIVYCPLHAAAQQMKDALDRVACALADITTSKDFDTGNVKKYLESMYDDCKEILAAVQRKPKIPLDRDTNAI